MGPRDRRAEKYYRAVDDMAKAAEADGFKNLSTVLETVAAAISFGVTHDLADSCLHFWTRRALPVMADDRQAHVRPGDRIAGKRKLHTTDN